MPHPVHLGVDFGTSHTVAVVRLDDGTTAPLLFDGTPLLPSAVYAHRDGVLRTGRDAVHASRIDPARFEPHPKRRVDDGAILLGDAEPSVAEIFAAILGRVRRECVRVHGAAPTTTITHPVSWGSTRRATLHGSAVAAGLPDPRLLPEPVAAATYFADRHVVPDGSSVVVFDFGGGTLDVSVVERSDGGFRVLRVDGAEDIGGVDIDHAIVGRLAERFENDPEWATLIDPRTTEDGRRRGTLLNEARSAKEQLSRHASADMVIPLSNAETHVTRAELEALIGPMLERAALIARSAVDASGAAAVAGVFLVGGSSRTPLVATLLHRALGIAPTVIDEPELVVAHGATMAATVVPEPPRPPERAPAPVSAPAHETREEPAAVPTGAPPPLPLPRWFVVTRVLLVLHALALFVVTALVLDDALAGSDTWHPEERDAVAGEMSTAVVGGAVAAVAATAAAVLAWRRPDRARLTIATAATGMIGVSVVVVASQWNLIGEVIVVALVASLVLLTGPMLASARRLVDPRRDPQAVTRWTRPVACTLIWTQTALIGVETATAVAGAIGWREWSDDAAVASPASMIVLHVVLLTIVGGGAVATVTPSASRLRVATGTQYVAAGLILVTALGTGFADLPHLTDTGTVVVTWSEGSPSILLIPVYFLALTAIPALHASRRRRAETTIERPWWMTAAAVAARTQFTAMGIVALFGAVLTHAFPSEASVPSMAVLLSAAAAAGASAWALGARPLDEVTRRVALVGQYAVLMLLPVMALLTGTVDPAPTVLLGVLAAPAVGVVPAVHASREGILTGHVPAASG